MKTILFINPWIYDFTAYDFWLKPLGFLQIAAIVRQATKAQVNFIDCLDRFHPKLKQNLPAKPDGRGAFLKEEVAKPEVLNFVPRRFSRYGLPLDLFKEELSRQPRPEAVLVTCGMTYWYPGVQEVTRQVRKLWGGVPVILGGVYPTLVPEHARRESGVDIVIQGPAENQVLSVLREILGNDLIEEREYKSLNDLPLPAYDLLRERSSLPILTSRGCPFRCSFCASHLLFNRFEKRQPGLVLADINYLIRHLGCRHLAFYDDALLLDSHAHIRVILRGIIEKGMMVRLHSPNGLHVREIDAELAQLMRQAGFGSIFLSQESFDSGWLSNASPKVSAGDLERALIHLEAAGFTRAEINVYLLVGLPDQDWAQVEDDVKRVISLGARPKLAFFSPIPGTQEWQRLVVQGGLKETSDPLLQNKMAFLFAQGEEVLRRLKGVKNLQSSQRR